VPLVHGRPAPALADAAASGEVALAGCRVPADPPNWACAKGHRWRDDSDEAGWTARLTRVVHHHRHAAG
jgi:hypothetical protein